MEQGECAGKQIGRSDLFEQSDIIAVLALGHLGDLRFGGRAAGQDQRQRAAPRDPAQVLVGGPVERQPLFIGQPLPGQIMVFSGVGNDAVEIEDAGLYVHKLVSAIVSAA